MPEGSQGYERELGGINATLTGINTTLNSLAGELEDQRDESNQWRVALRDKLDQHARRADDAIDILNMKTRALETDLANHKAEERESRRLIWKVLIGTGAVGGAVATAWSKAQGAVTNLFK